MSLRLLVLLLKRAGERLVLIVNCKLPGMVRGMSRHLLVVDGSLGIRVIRVIGMYVWNVYSFKN